MKHEGRESQAIIYSFAPLEFFHVLYLFVSQCSVKIYEVPNTLPYVQANTLFCCSFMDAGRHKTPSSKTKDSVIRGIPSSISIICIRAAHPSFHRVMFGRPDDTYICSGVHQRGSLNLGNPCPVLWEACPYFAPGESATSTSQNYKKTCSLSEERCYRHLLRLFTTETSLNKTI